MIAYIVFALKYGFLVRIQAFGVGTTEPTGINPIEPCKLPDFTTRAEGAVAGGNADFPRCPREIGARQDTRARRLGKLISRVAGSKVQLLKVSSMNRFRMAAAAAALFSVALVASPVHAFFHAWRFSEFFSNADGSVQFIELRCPVSGEIFAQGGQIRSQSTGKVFTFPSNLSGNTLNKNLLVATAGFASLPGAVTPDFTLPSASFFNPDGDTMTLFQSFAIDTRTFASVPKDGVMSRNFPANALATNSPTNFAGASGSVNLAPQLLAGDFNGDHVVDAADLADWQGDFNLNGDSDADGDLDSDGADFLVWQQQLGGSTPDVSAATAIPEPAAAWLALPAIVVGCFRSKRGSLRQFMS
jgi:hypothetical protein